MLKFQIIHKIYEFRTALFHSYFIKNKVLHLHPWDQGLVAPGVTSGSADGILGPLARWFEIQQHFLDFMHDAVAGTFIPSHKCPLA